MKPAHKRLIVFLGWAGAVLALSYGATVMALRAVPPCCPPEPPPAQTTKED